MFPFYITREMAIAAGMTHEGSMFGVPAWLAETGAEEISGCPKVPALQLWCMGVDALMELSLYFIPEDVSVLTPIRLGKRIGA